MDIIHDVQLLDETARPSTPAAMPVHLFIFRFEALDFFIFLKVIIGALFDLRCCP
jgi:hypothetical protein